MVTRPHRTHTLLQFHKTAELSPDDTSGALVTLPCSAAYIPNGRKRSSSVGVGEMEMSFGPPSHVCMTPGFQPPRRPVGIRGLQVTHAV